MELSFGDLASKGGADIKARILVMFIAFIPMFAISEIANLLGESKLFELSFQHSGSVGTSTPEVTTGASLSQS